MSLKSERGKACAYLLGCPPHSSGETRGPLENARWRRRAQDFDSLPQQRARLLRAFYFRPPARTISRGIAIHDGTKNHLWVNGDPVATTDAQDGKAVVVNGGKRLDLGVGLCNLHWPADSAELLIYNRGLTEAETSALDAYLACIYFR